MDSSPVTLTGPSAVSAVPQALCESQRLTLRRALLVFINGEMSGGAVRERVGASD